MLEEGVKSGNQWAGCLNRISFRGEDVCLGIIGRRFLLFRMVYCSSR